MTLIWAYLAGVLTLVNPCVLPLLPIIIATAFQNTRHGPLLLAAGLTLSFTLIGVGVTAFGHLIGLDTDRINQIAAIVMMAFGIVLLVPRAHNLVAAFSTPLASGANDRLDRIQGTGASGQFLVGVLLGAVWSPCIGPTLGGAIGLAASGEGLLQATATMLVFGLGVSSVLTALAYGSREMLHARRARLMSVMPYAKPVMGATLLLVGIALYFHLFRHAEIWLLDNMPIWLQDLSVRF
ncbi:MAG: cytochrome c biogenesis protein CcdA [Gammaproteobacteria bacterium]|nr:cytochrome c biogenesis protein CcdA [Gammaproteobacteria bacterium]